MNRSLRATFLGLVVNILLAASKMAAGVIGHSHALIADGVESLSDIFSSIIVWRGLVVAAAPADEDHPYGHGKAEPIAAAFVSVLLLVAAGIIVVTSIMDFRGPRPGPRPFTLIVLLIVVGLKEGLFRFVAREASRVESTAVQTDAWHHRSDAITSLAAAIGISVALLGGPNFRMADGIAAIFAAAVIAWNGSRLLRGSLSELMDQTPDPGLNSRIREMAREVGGVNAVEKCLVRKMGYEYFVDLHVEVDPEMTVKEAHRIAHEVKDHLRERVPKISDVLVHIEPGKNSSYRPV